MFAALIFFVLVVEYTVERAMEHYGYKQLLDKLVSGSAQNPTSIYQSNFALSSEIRNGTA